MQLIVINSRSLKRKDEYSEINPKKIDFFLGRREGCREVRLLFLRMLTRGMRLDYSHLQEEDEDYSVNCRKIKEKHDVNVCRSVRMSTDLY